MVVIDSPRKLSLSETQMNLDWALEVEHFRHLKICCFGLL